MAFKHQVYRWFKVVRAVKVWQLLILLAILIGAAAYLLRQNNLEMVSLRDAVKVADEESGDVKLALTNLQHYVTAHMNTSLGDGIALQGSYKRAYDAAAQKALSAANPSSQIYEQVELQCRPVFKRTHSFPAYTQCAREKLSTLAPGQDSLTNFAPPSADLFKFNYVSPLWSPDLAGFTVLTAVFVGVLLVARIVGYLVLRAILRAHQ